MTSQIAGIDVLRILVKKVLTMGDVVILGMTSEDGMKTDQTLLSCGLLRGDFAKYWF